MDSQEVIRLSLNTAQKFYILAANFEAEGIAEGDDEKWFLGRDCAEQIAEAIRNQAGDSAFQRARELFESSRP